MAARNTPSKGGKPDKLMRDALMVAVNEDCPIRKTRKIRLIAEKLVDMAVEGDIQAIKEINDRIDGKAPQAVSVGDDDGGPVKLIVEWAKPRE